MDPTPDTVSWSTVAHVYNQVETLTLPLIEKMVLRATQLQSLNDPHAYALDMGCGQGALTSALKKLNPNLQVYGAAASRKMFHVYEMRVKEKGWKNVLMRVFDMRDLKGLKDEMFSHTLSAFMICHTAEPERIAREMYRVTMRGGILGLAVWGEPYFNAFNGPWTAACRQCMPDYEPVKIMDKAWTDMYEVKKRLEEVGWEDVEVWLGFERWSWDNVQALSNYFFFGDDHELKKMINSFKEREGDMETARKGFEKIIGDIYGLGDGRIVLRVLTVFAAARKQSGQSSSGASSDKRS